MLINLEIAFRNKEEFASNASHELRTPLTVMIGETDYFMSHEKSKEDCTKHISRLISDLKKLNLLINNLLELAQINKNTGIVLSDVHIDEIVFSAIHEVKAKYSERRIIPKINYPDNNNELLISGNSGMLEIAFKNLLDNACKFSNDDIVVELVITDNYINIIISYSGIGIPASEIESIYKPFSRASNVKYTGGFGIGLALVSKIMELHKAIMDIESKVNKGTRIDILFRREAG